MILETTVKEQPLSRRSRQHRIMVHAILNHLGMVSSGVHLMARPLATVPEEERSRRIAIYDAGGTGGAGARRLEAILGQMPKTLTRRLGPPEIRARGFRHYRYRRRGLLRFSWFGHTRFPVKSHLLK